MADPNNIIGGAMAMLRQWRNNGEQPHLPVPVAGPPAQPRANNVAEPCKLTSPTTMYQICLETFVRNLNRWNKKKTKSAPELRLIRFLPPFVLVDMLHTMAEDVDSHPLFCRQLRDVRLLAKLLNYSPARQRLFRCIGTVMEKSALKNHCVHNISEAFEEFVEKRYEFVPLPDPSLQTWATMKGREVNNGMPPLPGNKLRRLTHQQRKQLEFPFFHDEDLLRMGQQLHGDEDATTAAAYIEDMEREEEEEFGASNLPGQSGARDYFFYSVDVQEQKAKASSAAAVAQPPVKTTDLKKSDAVWECVFQEMRKTVDKRNGGKPQNGSQDDQVNLAADYKVLEALMDDQELVYLVRQRPFLATINFGLQIGSFMAEAGWLHDAIRVYQATLSMIRCLDETHTDYFLLHLDCLQRILNAESRFCLFNMAHRTSLRINAMVAAALERGQSLPACLLARICKERSMMHFVRSEYDMSFNWSQRALRLLQKSNVSERVASEVLLQAGKSCVVKRQYKRANLLITMAVSKTVAMFGRGHQRYADALLDYGFYLLNVDLIVNSVNVYSEALEIKKRVFGELNLNVGTANEDLAYALYVKEYSSGEFAPAREHIDEAINIMDALVPWNRLMLASAQRVKALILEEIALDQGFDSLLEQSEKLHESALQLSLEAFGEINVQTAKHYGNLGRLYQSMTRYEAAEKMHKRAIKIKTDLLGAYDYEVGLSIGHLASLYNYQMQKHREAEELYMKSIEISLRLFGESYSGLEYDYRGLCHIYELLHDMDKYFEYSRILDNWRNLRKRNEEMEQHLAAEEEVEDDDPSSVDEVIGKFFEANLENGGSGTGGTSEGTAAAAGAENGEGGNRGSSVS